MVGTTAPRHRAPNHRHPTVPGRVGLSIPVGGALPEALMPIDGKGMPPIRAIHGEQDPTVPVVEAERTVRHLAEVGVDITLTRFPGVGHTITKEMRTTLFGFLSSVQ